MLRWVILVNLVAVVPVAIFTRRTNDPVLEALAWVSAAGCGIQFWGGIAALVFVPGWRRFGAVAAFSALATTLLALMVSGFHL